MNRPACSDDEFKGPGLGPCALLVAEIRAPLSMTCGPVPKQGIDLLKLFRSFEDLRLAFFREEAGCGAFWQRAGCERVLQETTGRNVHQATSEAPTHSGRERQPVVRKVDPPSRSLHGMGVTARKLQGRPGNLYSSPEPNRAATVAIASHNCKLS